MTNRKIAQFVLDCGVFAGLHHGFELAALFVQFGEDFADVGPVEPGAGRTRGDLLRFHQRGENARNGVEQSGCGSPFHLSPWP